MRMVGETRGNYGNEYAAIKASGEGRDPGAEAGGRRAAARECNLREASAFFAAELGRPPLAS